MATPPLETTEANDDVNILQPITEPGPEENLEDTNQDQDAADLDPTSGESTESGSGEEEG